MGSLNGKVSLFQRANSLGMKYNSFGRETHSSLFAKEQFDSKLFFKIEHCLAQSSLRHVQMARRLAISFRANDSGEVAKVTKLHIDRALRSC
jgi:hypothetical protein